MKAVAYARYGSPDVLSVVEMPVPEPGPKQLLVAVAATSVNRSDWEVLTGSPACARLGGLYSPARRVIGSDIAGRVAAIGPGVTRFRLGDEVYGDNLNLMGGFAEYAVAAEASFTHKPPELTFVQASALPQAAAIAFQGTAGLASGARVLVNGGGGGAGSFAIQLARLAGAHVTGVDNGAKLSFMLAVGADAVVDFRTQDFTRLGPFDLILDLVAQRSVFAYRRALARRGAYLCVGGTARALLRVATVGAGLGLVTGRRLGVLIAAQGPAHFEPVADRCVSGEVRIPVDRTYPLDETPRALAYVGEGRALGKVVITP